VLALSLVLSAGTAYLQIAVVTLANAYGPSCMGTMLAGQGVVGASVSLVQLITAFSASTQSTIGTLREEGESRKAALRFFGTNTAFVMVGLCTFLVLQRTFLYSDMKTRMEDVKVSLAAVLEQDTVRAEQGEDHYRSVTGVKRYMSSQTQQRFSRVSSVQKKVVLACLSIAYIFTITLAVFPALTARVQSTDTDKSLPIIIFVALHFFVFNLGDLVGRVLPSAAPRLFLLRKMRVIACLCLLRTAFIPLLTFCNVSSTSSPHSTPSFVFSDSIFFSLMALLGLSNGILATSIFVIGPRQDDLTDSSEQGLAVGLLSWWLTFGLALGSLSSFVVAANL
jgi:equilibrative nucleoside transporter 1/2/3